MTKNTPHWIHFRTRDGELHSMFVKMDPRQFKAFLGLYQELMSNEDVWVLTNPFTAYFKTSTGGRDIVPQLLLPAREVVAIWYEEARLSGDSQEVISADSDILPRT